MASLFSACKSAVRNNSGGTFNIGGYDIDLELYRQSDINTDVQYGDVAFGDDDESKIVVVADNTITIPEGYTLTPDHPKKSLVLFCNNLVNNGTISMYQKAPNVLPHNFFILDSNIAGTARDIVIPAYANNGNINTSAGTNGTNRNCGSGGWGDHSNHGSGNHERGSYGVPGTAYAFGGGAGAGGILTRVYTEAKGIQCIPDSTYPMRGGASYYDDSTGGAASGGAGNPQGTTIYKGYGTTPEAVIGCGGRVIIFCINFTNNGLINVNGSTQNTYDMGNARFANGGASGGGAIDLFYTTLLEQGTITANGGGGPYSYNKGGDGSITLSQWSQTKLFKTEVKYFSQANVAYLLTQLSDRIKDSRMGE